MAEMTEMQVHEERVMNLVESSSGNPTITPLTKTNAALESAKKYKD